MDVGWTGIAANTLAELSVGSEFALSRPQLGLIAAILVLLVLVVISSRRRKGMDAASPRSYAREQRAVIREEARMRQDLEELLQRVQQSTREFGDEFDSRLGKLERLVREADERVNQLQRLIRAADGKATCDVMVSEDPLCSVGPPVSALPAVNLRHEAIYRLADGGRSAPEIAASTGDPVGEVELILALRSTAAAKSRTLSVCG